MARWFVTGASRGVGLSICKSLLAKGEFVYGACRNPDGARDLWELAADFKTHFKTVLLDVGVEEHYAKLKTDFAELDLDCLVNNAGVLKGGDDGFAKISFDDVRKSFEINTLGPMRVAQALLPSLKRSKNPKIANITSKMGSISDNSFGGYYAYRMSKTALNMFNKSFAIEHPHIVSLVIHPGWVQTDMGGASAPVDAFDSAEGIVKTIMAATSKDTGEFVDFKGAKISW